MHDAYNKKKKGTQHIKNKCAEQLKLTWSVVADVGSLMAGVDGSKPPPDNETLCLSATIWSPEKRIDAVD